MRNFNRYLLGGAVEVDVDSIGRVLLPEFLRDYAGLKTKVVIAGLHTRVEIWAENKWYEVTSKIEKEAENLAEKLGQIGMI